MIENIALSSREVDIIRLIYKNKNNEEIVNERLSVRKPSQHAKKIYSEKQKPKESWN